MVGVGRPWVAGSEMLSQLEPFRSELLGLRQAACVSATSWPPIGDWCVDPIGRAARAGPGWSRNRHALEGWVLPHSNGVARGAGRVTHSGARARPDWGFRDSLHPACSFRWRPCDVAALTSWLSATGHSRRDVIAPEPNQGTPLDAGPLVSGCSGCSGSRS